MRFFVVVADLHWQFRTVLVKRITYCITHRNNNKTAQPDCKNHCNLNVKAELVFACPILYPIKCYAKKKKTNMRDLPTTLLNTSIL